eukprot:CAMPEP_0197716192 /NCGR_PEP_ID=MMETSP1434-20131217/1167_1 /TAXON_ID=265543 /ORGANISM="Minutocellus polymorphus, Strain CCMP3303" /LENGTH=292 /DNA_ID=CAMNT_0043300513 /DNA_START=153 /DNA_END=1028 /DNA_ORIENTATION=-
MMHRKQSNVLVLLILASISAYIPNADGATLFIPSASLPSKKSRSGNHKDAISAAKSMNSVAFLSKLVALKETSEVRYFQSHQPEPAVANIARGGGVAGQKQKKKGNFRRRVVTAVQSGTVQLSAGRDDLDDETKVDCEKSQDIPDGGVASNSLSKTTTTEYTGNLWFMRNKGIRFRETVRVSDISSDGKSATVECITKYRTRSGWNDCSKVTCTLSAVDRGITMVTDSKLLVNLPLPGLAGKAVRSKISAAFESAAEDFFDIGEGAVETKNNSPADEVPTQTQLHVAKGLLW